jgi:glycosyltransferase involved in cell wall biosynthesis
MRPLFRGARLVHGIRWNPNSDSRLDRALRLTESVFGRLVDLYICNSRVAGITLERRAGVPQRMIRVAYNGLMQFPPERIVSNKRLTRIVTVANLNPRKGYLEYLEHVVVPLSRQLPSARFVIVGRDEMAGEVQRKSKALGVQDVVEFKGFLLDVSGELESAQVFVLPSLWNEGCPTSILEAMAHGLPVVAFAIDGIPELIGHGVSGFLVSPRDYVEMKRVIAELLARPDLSVRLGQAARAEVANHFSIERSANMHTTIFKELLQVCK